MGGGWVESAQRLGGEKWVSSGRVPPWQPNQRPLPPPTARAKLAGVAGHAGCVLPTHQSTPQALGPGRVNQWRGVGRAGRRRGLRARRADGAQVPHHLAQPRCGHDGERRARGGQLALRRGDGVEEAQRGGRRRCYRWGRRDRRAAAVACRARHAHFKHHAGRSGWRGVALVLAVSDRGLVLKCVSTHRPARGHVTCGSSVTAAGHVTSSYSSPARTTRRPVLARLPARQSPTSARPRPLTTTPPVCPHARDMPSRDASRHKRGTS